MELRLAAATGQIFGYLKELQEPDLTFTNILTLRLLDYCCSPVIFSPNVMTLHISMKLIKTTEKQIHIIFVQQAKVFLLRGHAMTSSCHSGPLLRPPRFILVLVSYFTHDA